jgi:hypothetical protein
MAAISFTSIGNTDSLPSCITDLQEQPGGYPPLKVSMNLGEFGVEHKIPGTDFSVQGIVYKSEIIFSIYSKAHAVLANATLDLVFLYKGKYRSLRSTLGYPSYDANERHYWTDRGNYIEIVKPSLDSYYGKKDQAAPALLQTIMEFAKKMTAGTRIYGFFGYDYPERFYRLGLRSNSDTNSRIEHGDSPGECDMYVSKECAQAFNRLIAENPIFP